MRAEPLPEEPVGVTALKNSGPMNRASTDVTPPASSTMRTVHRRSLSEPGEPYAWWCLLERDRHGAPVSGPRGPVMMLGSRKCPHRRHSGSFKSTGSQSPVLSQPW